MSGHVWIVHESGSIGLGKERQRLYSLSNGMIGDYEQANIRVKSLEEMRDERMNFYKERS
jgi:hypothetical protein